MERDGDGMKFIKGNGKEVDLQVTKREDLMELVFN